MAGDVAKLTSGGGKRPAAGGGSAVTSLAGFAAEGSVVTPLAGFGGAFLPHPPGGRKPMPAARKYPPAVSRRMPVAFSICRSDQPSWPSPTTCFFFSSFKTLLTSKEGTSPIEFNVLTYFLLAGFEVTTIGRIWVTAEEDKPLINVVDKQKGY